MKICPLCSKKYTNDRGVRSHMWRAHTESGKKHNSRKNYIPGTRKAWNKGLTKETDVRVRKNSESLAITLQHQVKNGIYKPRYMSDEAKRRLSLEQSLKNRGGKSKWFEVSGQKVQGTWEKTLAEKFNELGIVWYKPILHRDVWIYIMNNKKCSYTPDFYLPNENIYLEVKGYWWGNDKTKMEYVLSQHQDKKLIIIEKDQYKKLMQGELVW